MISDVNASTRYPWRALGLSFLAAGVGHIYCGQIQKGLLLYFAWFLAALLATIAAGLSPTTLGLVSLILIPMGLVTFLYFFAALDAFRIAKQTSSTGYVLRDYNRRGVYVVLICFGLLYPIFLTATVRSIVFQAFQVHSSSMEPGLRTGDRILANKLAVGRRRPKAGDIIIFRSPDNANQVYVKRIAALAGQSVDLDAQRVATDRDKPAMPGDAIAQHPPKTGSTSQMNASEAFTVPIRSVFVLGDNRANSLDSRQFGPIPEGDILGYVDYIFWPADDWRRFGAL